MLMEYKARFHLGPDLMSKRLDTGISILGVQKLGKVAPVHYCFVSLHVKFIYEFKKKS